MKVHTQIRLLFKGSPQYHGNVSQGATMAARDSTASPWHHDYLNGHCS